MVAAAVLYSKFDGMIRTLCALFLFFLAGICMESQAQLPDSLWTFDHDSTSNSYYGDMHIDADSNIYLTCRIGTELTSIPGDFFIDVDFGAGETKLYDLKMRVLKYNKHYELQWARSFTKDITMFVSATQGDKVYLSGVFEDTVDFDPDTNSEVRRISRNKDSYFILELDTSGSFKRVQILDGLRSNVHFANLNKLGIRPNSDKSFYIYNTIEDSLDLDPGPNKVPVGAHSVSFGRALTSFILLLDSNLQYVKHVNIPNDSFLVSFSFIGNKIIAHGVQTGNWRPNMANPNLLLPWNGKHKWMFLEYDAQLNFKSYKEPFTGNFFQTTEIIPGPNGTFYLSASFKDTVCLDPALQKHRFISKGMSDILVMQVNNLNEFKPLATYSVGETGYESLRFVGRVNGDQLLFSVYMGSGNVTAPSPDFDPGPDTSVVEKNNNHGSGFLRLDADLRFRWVGSFGIVSGDFYTPGMEVINDTSLLVMGHLINQSSVDLDLSGKKMRYGIGYTIPKRFLFIRYRFPAPNTYADMDTLCEGDSVRFKHRYLTETGSYSEAWLTPLNNDSVVYLDLQVNPVYAYSAFETDTFCPKTVYEWRGKQILNSGIYYDSLKTTQGCDSVFSNSVVFRTIDTTLLHIGSSLIASGKYRTWQWWDCYADTAIAGEIFNGFEPVNGGIYAAIIYDFHGCSDTTRCYEVRFVGMDAVSYNRAVSVYPNPFNAELRIDGLSGGETLCLCNAVGQVLYSVTPVQPEQKISTAQLPAGMYFLKVSGKDGTYSIKLVKD